MRVIHRSCLHYLQENIGRSANYFAIANGEADMPAHHSHGNRCNKKNAQPTHDQLHPLCLCHSFVKPSSVANTRRQNFSTEGISTFSSGECAPLIVGPKLTCTERPTATKTQTVSVVCYWILSAGSFLHRNIFMHLDCRIGHNPS